MKFTLTTAGYTYCNFRDEEKIKIYKQLGFQFKETIRGDYKYYEKRTEEVEITIPSLEKLLEFQKEIGGIQLIIDGDYIKIYDDYIE